jgi:putative PIN family toxin of toxin-antitoxin system
MTRAVLDVNVFASAIIAPNGTTAEVLDAWRIGRFVLAVSTVILDELARVLRYPKLARRHLWSDQQIEAFMEDLSRLAILTPGRLRLAVVHDDPSDDRYLECALEAGARYVVSGDRHLIKLGQYESITIVTPRQFLNVLPASRRDR